MRGCVMMGGRGWGGRGIRFDFDDDDGLGWVGFFGAGGFWLFGDDWSLMNSFLATDTRVMSVFV